MESSSIIGTETAVSKALSLTPLNSWLFKYCLGGGDSDGKTGRLLSDPWYRHMTKAPRMAALPPLVCEWETNCKYIYSNYTNKNVNVILILGTVCILRYFHSHTLSIICYTVAVIWVINK